MKAFKELKEGDELYEHTLQGIITMWIEEILPSRDPKKLYLGVCDSEDSEGEIIINNPREILDIHDKIILSTDKRFQNYINLIYENL